jgi:hypothetical protein
MERVKTIENLRENRILPEEFVRDFPKESLIILWLSESEEERPDIWELKSFLNGWVGCYGLENGSVCLDDGYHSKTETGLVENTNEKNRTCDCCIKLLEENQRLKERIFNLEKELDDFRRK